MAHRPYTFDNSFSNSNEIHLLPNLFVRNRSESRLVKSSTADNLHAATTSIITKLRTRNKKVEKSVDPEVAAAVVKKYLLPMFEAKSKSISALNRSYKFGTDERKTAQKGRLGTREDVYSDLKLTETLMAEIEVLRQALELSMGETREAKQMLIINEGESNHIKERFENLEMNFELVLFQLNQEFKQSQTNESKWRILADQLEKYKKLYSESSSREEELNLKLHQERAENDIRFMFFYIILNLSK